MSSAARKVFSTARPLRSLVATTRRGYSTIPTKNTNPTPPIEPSNEQAMPMGRYYEAILNTPQPIPDKKPEEPASSVKERQQPESTPESKEPAPKATRGRKPKEDKATTASPAAPKTTSKAKAALKSMPRVLPSEPSVTAPPPSVSTSPPVPTPPPTSAQEQAKVIFGTRLAGPTDRAERLAEMRSRSKLIAGVLVPPKPDEPDNCCMSGCVNCVWDLFRDEMEEWAMANGEAEKRLKLQEASGGAAGSSSVPPPVGVGAAAVGAKGSDHVAASMDEDGGGSETNWEAQESGSGSGSESGQLAKNFWDEGLYKNVPVGIREFMKQEKRLKEKHMKEGTSGG